MAPPREQGDERLTEIILEAIDQTIADIQERHGSGDPRLKNLYELREHIDAESLDVLTDNDD